MGWEVNGSGTERGRKRMREWNVFRKQKQKQKQFPRVLLLSLPLWLLQILQLLELCNVAGLLHLSLSILLVVILVCRVSQIVHPNFMVHHAFLQYLSLPHIVWLDSSGLHQTPPD